MSRIFHIPSPGDEQGQTLVEYSLILAFVAVLCVGALQIVGTSVATMITSVANQV
jgi:Flp pilus assembly pilin Flp